MTQHTPTPWILQEVKSDADQSYRVISNANNETDSFGSGWGDISDASGLIFHDAHYYPMAPNKEDAAFIVRAVNSYDSLVVYLEYAEEELTRIYDSIKNGVTDLELSIGQWRRLRTIRSVLDLAKVSQ